MTPYVGYKYAFYIHQTQAESLRGLHFSVYAISYRVDICILSKNVALHKPEANIAVGFFFAFKENNKQTRQNMRT